MMKNVLNQRFTLGRLLVVLLFAGGLVFAGTYESFVVETEAQKESCCGSTAAVPSDDTTMQSQTGSCCNGAETPGLLSDDACECLGRGCGDTSCSGCSKVDDCDDGCKCTTCNAHCSNKDSDSTMCGDGSGCTDGDRAGGSE